MRNPILVLASIALATAPAARAETPIAAGGELLVNTYTTNDQLRSSVAMAPNGGFVVAWESYGSVDDDTDGRSVQARRYASDGDPLGGQFQVNTYTTSDQDAASVAMEPDGDFVVVWASYGSDGSDTSYLSVQGQRYASSGDPLGGQFQVNTYTTYEQADPSVAVDAEGDFVVVWESYLTSVAEDEGFNILAQRFEVTGPDLCDGDDVTGDADEDGICADLDCDDGDPSNACAIFADGFESGNTSAWSASVP